MINAQFPVKSEQITGNSTTLMLIREVCIRRGCIKSQKITAKTLRRKKINIDYQAFAPLRLRGERKK